jgi:hypothetical protein
MDRDGPFAAIFIFSGSPRSARIGMGQEKRILPRWQKWLYGSESAILAIWPERELVSF